MWTNLQELADCSYLLKKLVKNFIFQSSIWCDVLFFFGLTLNMVSNTIINKGWNSYVAI